MRTRRRDAPDNSEGGGMDQGDTAGSLRNLLTIPRHTRSDGGRMRGGLFRCSFCGTRPAATDHGEVVSRGCHTLSACRQRRIKFYRSFVAQHPAVFPNPWNQAYSKIVELGLL